MTTETPFERSGDVIRFDQYGLKLDFRVSTSNSAYYEWLDEMVSKISCIIPGASILEKEGDRTEPRRNTGVYYDTIDYQLLHGNVVLRTTSNPRTHAFCAFKLGEDQTHVRRDHRYVFDGQAKRTIQLGPTSPEAVTVVQELLAREDIAHPGKFLFESTGISGSMLLPALCLAQDRRTFYVLLDGSDALRCSLDRVEVTNLRLPTPTETVWRFSEVEVPIYPRISPATASDPRLRLLIEALADSLRDRFKVAIVSDSKYRRAARLVGLWPSIRSESAD